jgi:RNA polymerase sigma factor (TIGR02999 family)
VSIVADDRAEEFERLLGDVNWDDSKAAKRILPVVYAELRALAGSFFRGQNPNHTLQPTALVHEAYVRLFDQTRVDWNDRAHFFAVAATAMRQILTDHARSRRAAKRGGGQVPVMLDEALHASTEKSIDLIALDELLTRLETYDARMHRIVELRFFGGLSVDETAQVLKVSKSTVESDWRGARAWLNHELSKGDES